MTFGSKNQNSKYFCQRTFTTTEYCNQTSYLGLQITTVLVELMSDGYLHNIKGISGHVQRYCLGKPDKWVMGGSGRCSLIGRVYSQHSSAVVAVL